MPTLPVWRGVCGWAEGGEKGKILVEILRLALDIYSVPEAMQNSGYYKWIIYILLEDFVVQ